MFSGAWNIMGTQISQCEFHQKFNILLTSCLMSGNHIVANLDVQFHGYFTCQVSMGIIIAFANSNVPSRPVNLNAVDIVGLQKPQLGAQ